MLFSYLTPENPGLQSNNLQIILFLCYVPSENLTFSSTTFRNSMFVWHLGKVLSTRGVGMVVWSLVNCRRYAILEERTKIMLISELFVVNVYYSWPFSLIFH